MKIFSRYSEKEQDELLNVTPYRRMCIGVLGMCLQQAILPGRSFSAFASEGNLQELLFTPISIFLVCFLVPGASTVD